MHPMPLECSLFRLFLSGGDVDDVRACPCSGRSKTGEKNEKQNADAFHVYLHEMKTRFELRDSGTLTSGGGASQRAGTALRRGENLENLHGQFYGCSTAAAKKNDRRQALPMCIDFHTGQAWLTLYLVSSTIQSA